MTRVLFLLPVSGEPSKVREKWDLKQLQGFVEGYIELVATCYQGIGMYVNEEGLVRDLPVNVGATACAHPGVRTMGGIRGNAVLFDLTEES